MPAALIAAATMTMIVVLSTLDASARLSAKRTLQRRAAVTAKIARQPFQGSIDPNELQIVAGLRSSFLTRVLGMDGFEGLAPKGEERRRPLLTSSFGG